MRLLGLVDMEKRMKKKREVADALVALPIVLVPNDYVLTYSHQNSMVKLVNAQ